MGDRLTAQHFVDGPVIQLFKLNITSIYNYLIYLKKFKINYFPTLNTATTRIHQGIFAEFRTILASLDTIS